MGTIIARGHGYKIPIIIGYGVAVPLRCTIIVLLNELWPNKYALMSTQLLDGIGAGTFGLSLPLVVNQLTEGSGRFSFTFGVMLSLHMSASALSNLIAGYVVTYMSYLVGFITLGVMGSISIVFMAFASINPSKKDLILQ